MRRAKPKPKPDLDGVGLRVHGHDRNNEEDREADDGGEVAHDGIEIAEHLDCRQLPHLRVRF